MRQLVEKVELHDKLNPKIWNEDGTLRKEVEEKLHEIVDQFILELYNSDIPIKVLDARLVGSNASFNYTENSDMDVHLIVNTQEASCDTNVLTLLYNYFKSNFNDKYDISIHGIPVELYIEDVGASAVSNGIYSIYDDEWIKYPEPVEVPDIDITDDFAVLERRYKNIIEDNDAEGAEELLDELYLRRKDSLATEGEYGKDNLLFKQFRSEGYLDGLKEVLNGITSKELSLEALMEDIHEDDDTYYRVEIRTADGYQGGLFHTIDQVVDDGEVWEEGSTEYELLSSVYDLEELLGNAPEMHNKDAVFAYKEDEFIKVFDILKEISEMLDSLGAKLIIREIHNPKKIEYEDDKQVAVVEGILDEAKEDNQKLIDFIGDEYANIFFTLKKQGRLTSPQNDIYYWLKKKPQELRDFLMDMHLSRSNSEQRRLDKSGADLVYNKDGWKIYRIDTYDSAKYYGKGTKWCISGNYPGQESKGEAYFNDYKNLGVKDYYFIINPENHKWCYLYANANFPESVLWDEKDNGVSDIYDDTIPNFPKEAIEVLPGIKVHMNTTGDVADLIRFAKENNGWLRVTNDIKNKLERLSDEGTNEIKKYITKVEILGEADIISTNLFKNFNLEKVQIDDGIIAIEHSAFRDCHSLKFVRLPKTLKFIQEYAFANCESLENIKIPSTIKYIGDYAFFGCKDLTIACEVTEEYAETKFDTFWNAKNLGSYRNKFEDQEFVPVKYKSEECLLEDAKTKEWAVDKFSKAFLKYMPNMPSSNLMLQAKLKDLDESEWKKIVDFANSLSFPLTIYRGLKLENEESLDVKDLGVNWTVDDTLFFAPNSSFKNSNYVIKGQITEDDIDWEETIQNFVYYSLRPRYGFYPENEVTLKKNFTLQNPELFRKDVNSLVLVKTLNESLVVESRNHMDIEEMIEQAYYRHPKPKEIFEEPWDELVDPKQFYSDLTRGASPEYKARARKQILMNTEKDLIYNVLLGYLDSLGTGNTDYLKLEPAIAKKIEGKIVPQDGGHRAVLCKMLGMKLPVKFVETYQESVDRTVYNALYAFPKYVEKYGKGSALFELKYKYNLQDDELVWIINKLIDSGRIDMFTRDIYISQLGLEDYEEDIKKVIEEDYLDDEEKFWDYHTENISGNQVFDETTQESSYGKKLIDLAKSGKSDSKGRKAKIIQMTPMQYFEGCALGFGTSVQSQIRQVKNDKGTLDLLNDVIDKYYKRFPITYLDFSGTTFGQEGRHRMYIAGERYGWDTKFPVLVIYSGKEPDYGKYKRMGYDNEEKEETETVDIDIDDIDLEDLAIFEALEEFGDSKGVKLFL